MEKTFPNVAGPRVIEVPLIYCPASARISAEGLTQITLFYEGDVMHREDVQGVWEAETPPTFDAIRVVLEGAADVHVQITQSSRSQARPLWSLFLPSSWLGSFGASQR